MICDRYEYDDIYRDLRYRGQKDPVLVVRANEHLSKLSLIKKTEQNKVT